ncbi:hypothetical protein CONPUDRAFT_80240 [Coniophora puteana RWD-64-598 SS2]|uniref:xylan 1,4-beta-xylosidase n=1 Tax=Coniophora puteana (strain RWD-64-598) TaxID=741705 RepID=A0A5M3N4N4_CONPW|nr:uncharacterized protein CONPUDRAFT_80240 [Coniophora puteana RWD-64-598 SS2]EIW85871.1 hypothetical protein CONPUDRAFT_80240 [Coniophora puteana RWD-64-598 SS2]
MKRLDGVLLAIALAASQVSAYGFPDCTTAPLVNNSVCDTSLNATQRAAALIDLFTVDELIVNTVNWAPGVPRLGLPAYEWWSEGLHGVANSAGVTWSITGPFSYATSFPQPILMSAAFDDALIKAVGGVIGMEGRAFNNYGHAGLDFWTPNINPFKDPRWGRGQETPGEDPYHIAQYVYNLIQGLQGGLDPEPYFQVVATCKHFAGYDLEDWDFNYRYGYNAIISTQDLSEYYLPSFQSCYRDAFAGASMCSYNAINGIPTCADTYLLQDILRGFWGFDQTRWVTGDCDSVEDIYDFHHYTALPQQAAADALKAGSDIDCGIFYTTWLPLAYTESLITEQDLRAALTRQYASLVRLGYFDPASEQPYRQYNWSNVDTSYAQELAYTAAVEGITLLKNDGTLPFSSAIKNIALIGPWTFATTQMQGNYYGNAPYLISPYQGAQLAGYNISYVLETNVTSNTTDGYAAAFTAAQGADAIVFVGGIDNTVEAEAMDRNDITWPAFQLWLIGELGKLGKPLVVVQFGGGQVDDTEINANPDVNALLWGGYPGQSGGQALFDIISGKVAPAGRLVSTQYPADYVNEIPMTNMNLRPDANGTTSPGRTYKWYTGTPVYEFGYGLHYTNFTYAWTKAPAATYSIEALVAAGQGSAHIDLAPFDTLSVEVTNAGAVTSDYSALLFVNGTYGPAPYPNKSLAAYTRLHNVTAGASQTATFEVVLNQIARADVQGNFWLYPGAYEVALDTTRALTAQFTLTGDAYQLTYFPQPPNATATN